MADKDWCLPFTQHWGLVGGGTLRLILPAAALTAANSCSFPRAVPLARRGRHDAPQSPLSPDATEHTPLSLCGLHYRSSLSN